MSAVLCLPVCLCVFAAASRGQAPHGNASIPLWLVLACRLRARSVWRPGALAWVRLFFVLPAGAGGWGVAAGPAPASLSGAAVLPGGGRIIPSASGGLRPAPPRLAGPWGGWGDRAGFAPWLPCSLFWGAACGSLPSPPFVAGAFLSGVRVRSGSWGSPVRRVRPAAGGPAWRGGGGGRGPANRPPGGFDRLSPSLCPP